MYNIIINIVTGRILSCDGAGFDIQVQGLNPAKDIDNNGKII